MNSPEALLIYCGGPTEIVGAMNAVMPQLPPEIRRGLNRLKLAYLQSYGTEGLFARTNNRTVAEILTECGDIEISGRVASGERGGIRYELFEGDHSRRESS